MDEIKQAVEIEFQGPGKLLGYHALHQKIPELHRLNVPRNLVYDVMADINPEGLEARGGVGQPKRPKRNQVFLASGRCGAAKTSKKKSSLSCKCKFRSFWTPFLSFTLMNASTVFSMW